MAALNAATTLDPTTSSLLEQIRTAVTVCPGVTCSITTLSTDNNRESFTWFVPNKGVRHSPTGRVDVNLTSRHRISGTYYWQRFTGTADLLNNAEPTWPGFPNVGIQQSYRTTGSLTLRSTLSSNKVIGTVAAERPPFDVLLPNARFGADQSVNGVGVADEQRYYLLATGLFHGAHPPRHVNYRSGTQLRDGDVIVARAIGFLGYGAADRATVIDPIALADPFLARFPAAHDPSWRVGHIRRALPAGYEASVRTGECAMEPALCDAWGDVRLVTRGPLFDEARRAALWRVWSGRFDDGVDVARIFVNVEP